MALTEIEYGSLASSDIMNNNFRHLDNRISNVSDSIATINSNIASINSTISTSQENVQNQINDINKIIDKKVFLEQTYINGKSGYRIWSDGYCEQWGTVSINSQNFKITLIKDYIDTNYQITISCISNNDRGYTQSISIASNKDFYMIIGKATNEGVSLYPGTLNVMWHTYGFITKGDENGI